MLRYYVKRSRGEEFEEVHMPTDGMVCVYGEDVTAADIDQLTERYKLDRNILEDVRDAAELPRLEFSKGREYIFLRTPRATRRGRIVTTPILAVMGTSEFFILCHDGMFSNEVLKKSVFSQGQKTKQLLLGLLAGLVSSYEVLIDQTGSVIRDTGRRLRTHEVTNQDLIHFVTVETNLNEYTMSLAGILAVAKRLKDNKHNYFDEVDCEGLDDIILHIEQLLAGVDISAKRVESIKGAYTTIANNNLNKRIKTLTVLTLLVALPNVFYGMYGMNVVLPFAKQPWAYGAIVGFTFLLIIIVYALARRLKIF